MKLKDKETKETYNVSEAFGKTVKEGYEYFKSQGDRIDNIAKLMKTHNNSRLINKYKSLKNKYFRAKDGVFYRQSVRDYISNFVNSFIYGARSINEDLYIDVMAHMMMDCDLDDNMKGLIDKEINQVVLVRFIRFCQTIESKNFIFSADLYKEDEILRALKRSKILNDLEIEDYESYFKEFEEDEEILKSRLSAEQYDILNAKRVVDFNFCRDNNLRESDFHAAIRLKEIGLDAFIEEYELEKENTKLPPKLDDVYVYFYEPAEEEKPKSQFNEDIVVYPEITEEEAIIIEDKKVEENIEEPVVEPEIEPVVIEPEIEPVVESVVVEPVIEEKIEEPKKVEKVVKIVKNNEKMAQKPKKVLKIINSTNKKEEDMGIMDTIETGFTTFAKSVGNFMGISSTEDDVARQIKDGYKNGNYYDPSRIKGPNDTFVRNMQDAIVSRRGYTVDGSEVFFMLKNFSEYPVILMGPSGATFPLKPCLVEMAMNKDYQTQPYIEFASMVADKTFDTSRTPIFDIANSGRYLANIRYPIPDPNLEPVYIEALNLIAFANEAHYRKMMDNYNWDLPSLFADINRLMYSPAVTGINHYFINLSSSTHDLYIVRNRQIMKIPRATTATRNALARELNITNITDEEFVLISGTYSRSDKENLDIAKDGKPSFPYTKDGLKVIRIPKSIMTEFHEGTPQIDDDTGTFFFLTREDAQKFLENCGSVSKYYELVAKLKYDKAKEEEITKIKQFYGKRQGLIVQKIGALVSGGAFTVLAEKLIEKIISGRDKGGELASLKFNPFTNNTDKKTISNLGKFRIKTGSQGGQEEQVIRKLIIRKDGSGIIKTIKKPVEKVKEMVETVKETAKNVKTTFELYMETLKAKRTEEMALMAKKAASVPKVYKTMAESYKAYTTMKAASGLISTVSKVSTGMKILSGLKAFAGFAMSALPFVAFLI